MTLYVPSASLSLYKSSYLWSSFGTILPIPPTGIGNNTAVEPETIDAIYNLEGKRIKGTQRGLNIIRMSDGTTKKVFK